MSEAVITVYSKPRCVQCDATKRWLDARNVDHEVVDVSQDAAALERIKELGYLQAPVVVTPDSHWSGFNPDKLGEALSQLVAA